MVDHELFGLLKRVVMGDLAGFTADQGTALRSNSRSPDGRWSRGEDRLREVSAGVERWTVARFGHTPAGLGSGLDPCGFGPFHLR